MTTSPPPRIFPTQLLAAPVWRRVASALLVYLLSLGGASAAKFCVAPDGNDANPGTKERPFASLQRAQQAASPGDFVFIRGGTYQMKDSDIARRDSFLAALVYLDKSGLQGKPISYHAWPGERPVFDCSRVKPPGLRISAFRVRASWVHLKGLEVTGVQVTATGHTQSICFENFGDHNVYENLSMHDGQAIGLFITRGSNNLVLNCDAYRNHDSTSEGGRGGNTDGFGCHVPGRGANNVFKGCRAWFNSDDGFDCINSNDAASFVNCWALYNGYSVDFKPLGDGNGFKAGGYGIAPGTRFPNPVPRHRVVQCLAVRNRSAGFYANHHPGGIDWIHNSACRNSVNFNFLGRNAAGTADIPGGGHKILNNLAYGSTRDLRNLDLAASQHAGNSFDQVRKLTDADFLSLDEASLIAPRQANGDLPVIRFLHLAKGNPLRDTGVPAEMPYSGTAPDPGAFESP
jgi:hypothetical protein